MAPPSGSTRTVLVMSFTNMTTDPRVSRQIHWLAPHYRIVALGTEPPKTESVDFRRVVVQGKSSLWEMLPSAFFLATGRIEPYYWNHDFIRQAERDLADVEPDLVIANDLDTLPLALRVAKGAPVIFDAHEYYPAEFTNHLVWRMLVGPYRMRLCRRYLPQAKAMLTVCDGIAEEYRRVFGVDSTVLTNAPLPAPVTMRPTDPTRIRMIHHGATMPSRKVETMIQMMGMLDERFELDLMLLVTNQAYLDQLKALARPYPKVRFLPPIPMPEIVSFISQYDIGLYILEPANFNDRMALPNKFFEFLQARLAIAIGPSQEMAKIVTQFDCGVVAEDFRPDSLAKLLGELDTARIDHFKAQSDQAATHYNADANGARLLNLIERLMG